MASLSFKNEKGDWVEISASKGQIGNDATYVGETEPTGKDKTIWIDTSENTDTNITKINDDTISEKDTWSSRKVSNYTLDQMDVTNIHYSGEIVHANNCYDGEVRDLSIKGSSLVNLWDKSKKWNINSYPPLASMYSKIEINTCKVGVEYTAYGLIADKSSNLADALVDLIAYNKATSTRRSIYSRTGNSHGDIKVKFTLNGNETLMFCNWSVSEDRFIKNYPEFMILEGDYTTKTPMYFEKMKSAGQDNSITITSTGKNLFDIYSTSIFNLKEYGQPNVNGYLTSHQKWHLKPNTTYSVSSKFNDVGEGNGYFYIGSSTTGVGSVHFIYHGVESGMNTLRKGKITTGENGIVYFRYATMDQNKMDYIRSKLEFLMIEEGNTHTDFQEYKETSVTIPLPSSMNGLNGNKNIYLPDEIIGDKIIQRFCKKTGSQLMDGRTFKWLKQADADKNFWMLTFPIDGADGISAETGILSDRFLSIDGSWNIENNKHLKQTVDLAGTNNITVRLPCDYFETEKECCDYFDEAIFIYKLKNEIIHKINNFSIQSYKPSTNIFTIKKDVMPNINCRIPSKASAIIKELSDKNKILQDNLTEKTDLLNQVDMNLLNNDLDFDFRLLELELKK